MFCIEVLNIISHVIIYFMIYIINILKIIRIVYIVFDIDFRFFHIKISYLLLTHGNGNHMTQFYNSSLMD